MVQPVTRKAMDAKSFVNGLRGETVHWLEMPTPEQEEKNNTDIKVQLQI